VQHPADSPRVQRQELQFACRCTLGISFSPSRSSIGEAGSRLPTEAIDEIARHHKANAALLALKATEHRRALASIQTARLPLHGEFIALTAWLNCPRPAGARRAD
jgi:hypothetical protein